MALDLVATVHFPRWPRATPFAARNDIRGPLPNTVLCAIFRNIEPNEPPIKTLEP
jgi:hypothetical protein